MAGCAFPTIITIITIFFAGGTGLSFVPALIFCGVILFSLLCTFLAASLLSKTALRGVPSSFALELPPYRKPQIRQVLIRSLLDRTIFVLGRAIIVAAPAGALIWLLANVHIGDATLIMHLTSFLDPLGLAIGLSGAVLTAFILGFPANEIVVPIMIMCMCSLGTLTSAESYTDLQALLAANGWTMLTAVNMLIMTLLHFPCSTTILTIQKETGSLKWTALSFALPLAMGLGLCAATNAIFG